MANLSSKKLLAIAVVISLVTVSLIYTFLQSATRKIAAGDGEIVVVAKTNIPAKTRITPDMVRELRVPPEYIQPGAVREMPTVSGILTRQEIIAGEQLTERCLLVNGRYAGFSGVIPAGKRAITVAATDVTGVAGLVKAGDYVDVLVTFDQKTAGDIVTQIALQNLLVLSVNRENMAEQDEGTDKNVSKKAASKDPAMAKVANITLAVSPEDAARITIAEEKGKIKFALRPYVPETGMFVARPVHPSDLVAVRYSSNESGTSNPGPAASGTGRSSGNSTGIPVIRGTKIE